MYTKASHMRCLFVQKTICRIKKYTEEKEEGVMKIWVLVLLLVIAIWMFYKIRILESRFDVFTDKNDKKYQYDLEICCMDQAKKITMSSDRYYSDPWLLLQIYQKGQPVKGRLTIRCPDQIWSCRVDTITSISMTVSKRENEDERTTQTTNRKSTIRKNM